MRPGDAVLAGDGDLEPLVPLVEDGRRAGERADPALDAAFVVPDRLLGHQLEVRHHATGAVGGAQLHDRRAPALADGAIEVEAVVQPEQRIEPRQQRRKAALRRQLRALRVRGADQAGANAERGQDHGVGLDRAVAGLAVLDQHAGARGQFQARRRDPGGVGEHRISVVVAVVAELRRVGKLTKRPAGDDRRHLRRRDGAVRQNAARSRRDTDRLQLRADRRIGCRHRAGEIGPFLRREGHALVAVFEKGVPAEGRAILGTFEREAALMAPLLPLRILGELEVPGRAAIGVEHLQRVEMAEAVDGREADTVRQVDVHRQIGVIDVAVESELAGAEHLLAIGRARQLGIAIVAGLPAGGGMRARLERGARVALPVIGEDQVRGDRIARLPAERSADAALVLAIEVVLVDPALVLVRNVGIAGDVADVAAAVFVGKGDTPREHLVPRVQEAGDLGTIEVAVGAGDLSGEARLGRGRHDADRADRSRGAEQRRLRALHHLDAGQVVQVLIGATRTADVDAVVVERDARALLCGARVRGDAADHEPRVVGALLLHLKAGDERRHLVEFGHADVGHVRARQRGDRDRHVLDPLRPLLGRDDDIARFERRPVALRLRTCLRQRPRRNSRAERRQHEPQTTLPHLSVSPKRRRGPTREDR